MPTKERWAKLSSIEKQKYTKQARLWKQQNRDKWNAYQRLYTPTVTMTTAKKLRAEIRHKRIKHCAFTDELTLLVHSEAMDLRNRRNKSTLCKWHVDHIVPINGTTTCGLHIWSNLAVIPAYINLSKGNKETAKSLT